jgi:Rrf2 family protein
MLTLTRKTHYALIALAHLATEPDGFSSAREIAEQYHLPLPLLMNLLKQLTQQDLVHSVRGPKGGYTLARRPADITLTAVVRAVEGPIHITQCVPERDGAQVEDEEVAACVRIGSCPVRSSLERLHRWMMDYLDSVTLADVIGDMECCRKPQSAAGAPGESS